MKAPLLSIVIPAYNAEKTVSKIAGHVLGQPMRDLELIIVDDGSTDDTLKVLRKIASDDKRAKVLSRKNGGPSAARNTGITKARGKYLMFFDADDDIEPTMISTMTKHAETTQSNLVVCGWVIDKLENGQLKRGKRVIKLTDGEISGSRFDMTKAIVRSIGEDGRLYNLWNKIFKTDIIKNNRLAFREDLRFGEDLLFSLEYFKLIDKIDFIAKPLYRYRTGDNESVVSSSALNPQFRIENWQAIEKFVGKKRDQELDDLLGWVQYRWTISYLMSIGASTLSNREKLSLSRQTLLGTKLTRAKSKDFIGNRKFQLEYIFDILKCRPHLALFVMKTISNIKNTSIFQKMISHRSVNL